MSTILPILHLNGTSPQCLFDGYLAAYHATSDAIDTAQKIEFNARDYYCHPEPGAWQAAREEFSKQLKAMAEARDYFLKHAEHVQSVIQERAERSRG